MNVRYSYLPQQFEDCEDLWKDLRQFVQTGDFTLGHPLTTFEESFAGLIEDIARQWRKVKNVYLEIYLIL